LQEMEALAHSLQNHTAWPISLDDQIHATRVAFEVERQISGNTHRSFSAMAD